MAMSDDDWGCLVAVIAAGAGGWWLWSNYEVKEREPTPALALPEPARPTGWVNLASSDSGSVYNLAADTVSGPRKARSAWVYIDHSKNAEVAFRATRELNLVNCDTGGVKVLSHIEYDAEDEILSFSEYEEKDVDTSYYPPGSIGYTLPDEICDPVYDKPASGVSGGSSQ